MCLNTAISLIGRRQVALNGLQTFMEFNIHIFKPCWRVRESSQGYLILTQLFPCTFSSWIVIHAPEPHSLYFTALINISSFTVAGKRLNLKGHTIVPHYLPEEFYSHHHYESCQIYLFIYLPLLRRRYYECQSQLGIGTKSYI